MDADTVESYFKQFINEHTLNATQLRFLSMLWNHVATYGSIDIDRLYEPPFTTIDSNGVDGVFPKKEDVDDLIDILTTFQPEREDKP